MSRTFSSLSLSSSPEDERALTPVAQGDESKQPIKVFQETPAYKERAAPDLNSRSGSTYASEIRVQNGSSGPASQAKVQDGNGTQDLEVKSELSEEGECVQAAFSTPATIIYSMESDADSETIDSGVKHTDHTITGNITTTTTITRAEVEERRGTGVQKVEQSATASKGTVQPRRDVSTFSSRTYAGQQRYEAQSVNGAFSSTSKAIEIRRTGIVAPSKSTHSPVREQFLQMERLHREEKDRIVTLMTAEHEVYKRFCEEQFEAFQTENERLLREISASASRITLLEDQLNPMTVTAPQHDKVHSNTTIVTTTITTVTTTIATITNRIEQWKQTVTRNKGQVMISSKELDQLSLDLHSTSSQITGLQQGYDELSRDFSSIRHELRVTLSHHDAKDRTIASLTVEVAQWKNVDAAKAQQITDARQDNETLRRDLTAASARTAELQRRYDAQSSELTSAHTELQTKATLVEDRDRTIASFIAEVARWRQSDATNAEQITTTRQDYEKLQKDLSAASSKIAELQKRYDTQSKELSFVLDELQANKSLVEEKERTITTLTAEVDQWKLTDVTKAEQFAAEHRDKERLQQDLASFSSQRVDFQKRYDVQTQDIVSVRGELQNKVSLLEEKEHAVSSLTAEVAQAKHEDSMKAEQLATARKDVKQLRLELSSASSRIADLQKRYEAKSEELNVVSDKFHQIEILYPDGTDHGTVKPSEHAVSQHIARALEKKSKEMEELRQDLSASTTREIELQRSYEALSRDVSAVRDELKVKTSQNEGTITSLTVQVEQWMRTDTLKAERIATTLKQVEKLQIDLSISTSQLAELQVCYETQSREFIAVRKELQTSTSTNEGKNRTIVSLTAEVDQWKRADAKKTERITSTLQQVGMLQQDLTASGSELAELRGRYEAQSRELVAVRNELHTKISLHENHTIVSLTADVDQWKRADATKAEQIVTTLKLVEKLQKDLSVSTSQLAELQGRCEAQSYELVSVRDELHSRTLLIEEKERIVVTLTMQVEEWKRTDALKEERIMTIWRQAEDLQRDLTNSSSQNAGLQQRYRMQSKELRSLQRQVSGKCRICSILIAVLIFLFLIGAIPIYIITVVLRVRTS
ncbi:hypothetical protein J3R82DRAFT_7899 [Butyriboletus roseoflavus]|nr:hypothetical protein J3R82DRAFT_7899 [Butyriboletus roseoflavus]